MAPNQLEVWGWPSGGVVLSPFTVDTRSGGGNTLFWQSCRNGLWKGGVAQAGGQLQAWPSSRRLSTLLSRLEPGARAIDRSIVCCGVLWHLLAFCGSLQRGNPQSLKCVCVCPCAREHILGPACWTTGRVGVPEEESRKNRRPSFVISASSSDDCQHAKWGLLVYWLLVQNFFVIVQAQGIVSLFPNFPSCLTVGFSKQIRNRVSSGLLVIFDETNQPGYPPKKFKHTARTKQHL